MNISHIRIALGEESKINQGHQKLTIKSDSPQLTCAENVKIEFDTNYSIEIKENAAGQTVLVLTAGGIHRVMDTSTLQHLVTMTY
ncbi:MAG: hypothetical protein AAGU12_12745 [Clostridiales bacterium]